MKNKISYLNNRTKKKIKFKIFNLKTDWCISLVEHTGSEDRYSTLKYINFPDKEIPRKLYEIQRECY